MLPDARLIMRVLPEESAKELLTSREARPDALQAKYFVPQRPVEFKLENGLPVRLWTRKELPLVEMSLLIPRGAAVDEAAKSGRCALMADMLDEGAGDLDAMAYADALDLLVHVAWNGPAVTRRERARAIRRDREAFFDRFAPEARAVLDDLLEKYAEFGVTQLDDLRVLEVPPISARGSPVEIAERFGGAQALHEAVEELVGLLYVDETA